MSDEEPTSTTPQNNTNQKPQVSKFKILIDHVNANKIDTAMWTTRVLTIIFTFNYVLGIQTNAFNKVLLTNAATTALRLHQRLPTFSLSRDFLAKLLAEDSCHYFMYSLMFFNARPKLLILVPIFLFALLHAASYSLKLLDVVRLNSWDIFGRFLIAIVEFQAVNILRAIAFMEIFLMPLTILLTFMGDAGLLTPLLYHRFLFMRYSSRRNPYTRQAFRQLRILAESTAERSPAMVRQIVYKAISLISRLDQQQPQPQ